VDTRTASTERPASTAFESLYRTHYPALMRLGFLLTGSDEAAGDLVHAVFVRASGRLPLDDPAARLRAAVVTACRSRRRRAVPPAPLVMPNDLVEFRGLLLGLPRRARAAVVLAYFCDLSDAEIAALVGCRLGTARNLVQRGLADLRDHRSEEAVSDLLQRLAGFAHTQTFVVPEPLLLQTRRRRLR
jgi:DNA-directed RNA polymerase specialized sigma24 family protein